MPSLAWMLMAIAPEDRVTILTKHIKETKQMSEAIPFREARVKGPTDIQVSEAKAILAEREKAEKKAISETLVQCTTQVATGKGCGAWHPIKELTYIQTHWYNEPYGCTGGDNWYAGEGQWRCPSCGHLNRLYVTPEVEAMKAQFARIENTYKDRA